MASIASVRTSFDYVAFQQAVVEEIATPFITMPTKDYAHIMAYIRLIGGDPNDAVAGTTYYPAADSEPDLNDAPANSLKWRAVKDIFWAKGKMKLAEKMALIGQLVIHDSPPKETNPLKPLCMTVLARQAGMSPKTATRAIDANIEHGFVVRERPKNQTTGYTEVRTAVVAVPAFRVEIPEASLHAADRQRRHCRHCGSEDLIAQVKCRTCGAVLSTTELNAKVYEPSPIYDDGHDHTEPPVTHTTSLIVEPLVPGAGGPPKIMVDPLLASCFPNPSKLVAQALNYAEAPRDWGYAALHQQVAQLLEGSFMALCEERLTSQEIEDRKADLEDKKAAWLILHWRTCERPSCPWCKLDQPGWESRLPSATVNKLAYAGLAQ